MAGVQRLDFVERRELVDHLSPRDFQHHCQFFTEAQAWSVLEHNFHLLGSVRCRCGASALAQGAPRCVLSVSTLNRFGESCLLTVPVAGRGCVSVSLQCSFLLIRRVRAGTVALGFLVHTVCRYSTPNMGTLGRTDRKCLSILNSSFLCQLMILL